MASYALKTHLPPYLRDEQQRIEGFARDQGLEFFPTVFEMLTYDQMNEVASYGGFPTRYPHWRFGMEYERMSKSAEYGLHRIYEMVINNNPSIAYLLEGNSLVDQKLVMAHVYAHVDFFKNNYTFATTNQGVESRTGEPIRKWIDTMANHGAIVRRWANRIGIEKVESFIDHVLSLENLIDPNKPYQPTRKKKTREEEEQEAPAEEPQLLRVDREYMESFINPEEFVEKQRKKIEREKEQAKGFPERPDRDVLGFLIDNAPLERWERDVLTIIRREAYYFYPQMQTKIMNEGWACVAPDTPVFTASGLVPMRDVVEGRATVVSDGEAPRRVYDRNVIHDHETITLRTRRGFELTGSTNHRVMIATGEWKRLDELSPGDTLRVAGGCNLWPTEPSPIGDPLRSPEPVVRDWLRGWFDAAGRVTDTTIVLSSQDELLGRHLQLVLLNYGVMSSRTRLDGQWLVTVEGRAARRLSALIGIDGPPFATNEHERWEDEVVALERGRGDVYDISVEETHRYAAAGLVNHNSYWHSKIMTTKVCDASEIIEYADRNAGVMATGSGQLNPYKLGVELYRHIEERWNRGQFGKEWEDCDDLEARRIWDRRTGLGREKLFQVRRLYNDVMFIDEYLTPEFVADQKLYAFGYNNRNDRWEIETRKFEEVKRRLLFQLTNAGQPFIYVVDANYGNRGELLLQHDHQGIDLRLDWAREVLRSLERAWKRPVEIHTIVEGKPTLMRFDGNEHVQRPLK